MFGAALASPADLRILVYDYAGVSASILARAEHDAARIYQRIGIQTHWIPCRSSAEQAVVLPDCAIPRRSDVLELRLLPRAMAKRFRPDRTACGFAHLSREDGSGVSANVFCHRAEEIARRQQLDYGMILGHLIAHELGHMILGIGSHSATGIMRNPWGEIDLAAASRGALLFSHSEGEKIRARLHALRDQKLPVTATRATEGLWPYIATASSVFRPAGSRWPIGTAVTLPGASSSVLPGFSSPGARAPRCRPGTSARQIAPCRRPVRPPPARVRLLGHDHLDFRHPPACGYQQVRADAGHREGPFVRKSGLGDAGFDVSRS